jgi:5-oxoprolinase (ATP-hydrolysing) subunit A
MTMTPHQINLNADLGESFGAWTMGDDSALLQIVKSANVACGFHAGDPTVMQTTVRQAIAQGVSIGAHPSYPDLQGFGRRVMQMSAKDLEANLIYQIGALQAIAAAEGGRVTHVKPHGALHNVACADAEVATTVVKGLRKLDSSLILLAPPYSTLAKAAEDAGQPVRYEVFADRTYLDDGQLTPRSREGAVIHDSQACVSHVLRMLSAKAIVTANGLHLPCRIDSICVHGDGPEAVATAQAIRLALEAAGYTLTALTQLGDDQ